MNGLRYVCLALLTASTAAADDWPQWLGPDRDGMSGETIQPWKELPEPAWKVPVGEGHSSPVVADGRVYLHVKPEGREAEEILCFDVKTGKQLWKHAYDKPAFSTPFGNGPRGTPAVADGKVYALGITGILTCCDAVSGERVWQVDTLKEFGADNLRFGISGSPLVHDGKVYVNVGAEGASLVAFDAGTGEVAWKTGDDPASYSSPYLWEGDQATQIVFLTGANLIGVSPDGEVFWQSPFKDLLNESSTTPVRVGDLLVGSSVTAGSVGLKMATADGQPSAEQMWKNQKLTCYFSTPVVAGESHLYMVTGRLSLPALASATLNCVDAKTGEIAWSKEAVGKYHASLLKLADGKMLMLEDDGELVLLEGGVEEYKELARSKACGDTWAHPALADGMLFIRDADELLCLPMSD